MVEEISKPMVEVCLMYARYCKASVDGKSETRKEDGKGSQKGNTSQTKNKLVDSASTLSRWRARGRVEHGAGEMTFPLKAQSGCPVENRL